MEYVIGLIEGDRKTKYGRFVELSGLKERFIAFGVESLRKGILQTGSEWFNVLFWIQVVSNLRSDLGIHHCFAD